MTTAINELALTLILLASLAAIAGFRGRIASVSRESLSFIAIGTAILTIVSAARTMQSLGAFGQMPFVSDPGAFNLLNWIGVIAGAIFLISGVSQYVKRHRQARHSQEDRIERAELIRKTEQLVGVESRLAAIMSRTLANIVGSYGLPGGAVYQHDPAERRAILVGAVGSADRCFAEMERVEIDVDAFGSGDPETRNAANAVVGVPKELGQPTLVLPVSVAGRMYGLFLLWIGTDVLSDEALMNLRICLQVIARKIELDRQGRAERAAATQDQFSDLAMEAVDFRVGLRRNLIRLAEVVSTRFDSRYTSLSVLDDAGGVNRYTVGGSGTFLRELGINRYRLVSHIAGVIASREPLLLTKIQKEGETVVDLSIVDAGMRSLLAVPIGLPGEVRGVFTIASPRKSAFGESDRVLLNALEPTLRTLVDRERFECELQTREDRVAALHGLLQEAADSPQLDRVLRAAGELLASHLGISFVRVSLIEPNRTSLQSCALAISHDLEAATPADGHMALSLMPCHQRAIEGGCSHLINLSAEPEAMSEAETRLAVAPGVRSVLIVPISARGTTAGIITAADARSVDRISLGPDRLEFVEAVATILGLRIQVARSRVLQPEPSSNPRMPSGETGVLDRAGRIKSSLSGILGSIEVLQTQTEVPSRAKVERYLSIINRSARDLSECLNGEE